MPQTELETALANAYPQDIEKLAVDLLSERDYEVEPTGTSGADGGLDALLSDGDRVGALHVSRTQSDRLREKITSDADKLADHDQTYDFFVFVTTGDPSGALRQRLEAEIQETYGWKTTIWAREQLRNVLMTEHQGLAREHLNVNPGVQLDDHRDKVLELRCVRLDCIEVRNNLPNELPDGPGLAVHLIPNNVFSVGADTRIMNDTNDVLDHHLEAFADQVLEEIMIDYTDDSIVVTNLGIFRGRDEIEGLFADLCDEFSQEGTTLEVDDTIVEDDFAYLLWHAETPDNTYEFCTDTFYSTSPRRRSTSRPSPGRSNPRTD